MNTQITSLSIPHWKFHAFAWAIQINTEGEGEKKFASVSIMTESVGDKLTIGLACYVFYSKPKYFWGAPILYDKLKKFMYNYELQR